MANHHGFGVGFGAVVVALTDLIFSSLAMSITFTIRYHGAFLSALMASSELRILCQLPAATAA